MVLIGIDPHKSTHTAVAVDDREVPLAEFTVRADRLQVERLLKWAIDFPERLWAIESANGPRASAGSRLRRSVAMLQPGALALRREDAMRLMGQLAEVQARLDDLRSGLRHLLEESR